MTGGESPIREELERVERLGRIGTWHWDFTSDELTVSAAARAILGLPDEERTYTFGEITSVIGLGEPDRIDELMNHLREGGPPVELRTSVTTTAGERKVLEARMEAVRAEDGSPRILRGFFQDVTERWRAEREREAVHAVTRALAESVTVGEAIEGVLAALAQTTDWEAATFWTVDGEAGVLRSERVWLAPAHERKLRPLRDVTGPLELGPGAGAPGTAWAERRSVWREVDAADALPRRAAALASGLSGVLAFPLIGSSGDEVIGVIDLWRRSRSAPAEDVVELLGSFGRQIGQFMERTRAESQLQEYRALTASVIDAALECVITIDAVGHVIDWNPAAERTFGYRRAEVLGKEIAELIVPERHRERHRHGLGRASEGGGGTLLGRRVEIEALRASGEEFPVELTINRIGANPPTYTGWVRDITDRRRAEGELATRASQQAAVARLGSEALFSADVDAVVEAAVDIVVTTLGIEHCAVMELLEEEDGLLLRAGVGWEEGLAGSLVVPTGRASHAGTVIERGEPIVVEDAATEERFAIPAPLREHGIASAAGVVIAGDGGPIGSLGAYSTDRGRFGEDDIAFLQGVANVLAAAFAAERATALERRLQQAQRLDSMGKLAGGVAHDFNNLLGVILTYADLAMNEPEPGEAREEIAEIKRAAERAASLTRQLLLFSSRAATPGEIVRPAEVVAGMSRILGRAVGENIDLDVRSEPGLWPARIGASMLEQVVLNLVLNAGDAMPEGGRIVVELGNAPAARRRGAATGRRVRLSVIDEGVGMAPEVLDRAFEPFFTTKTEGRGTGLGLATCDGIVQRAGGRIEIQSELAAGTRIDVYLPAAAAAPADTEVRVSDEPKPVGGGETVLLVEDEEPLRRVTRRILEGAGYTVVDADGPESARVIWRARKDEVDVLLTDAVMPAGSGIELWRELARERPGLCVVYMSGYSPEEVGGEGQPPRRLLEKPFTSPELLGAVRGAVADAAARGGPD